MTMKEFCETHRISATFEAWQENPNMPDFDGYHFRVTFRRGRKLMRVPFSVGRGWTDEQRAALCAADVLNCVADDASMIENARDFEDWCGDQGYDADSRTAERIHKTCVRQARGLKAFVGDLYETLLWETERD